MHCVCWDREGGQGGEVVGVVGEGDARAGGGGGDDAGEAEGGGAVDAEGFEDGCVEAVGEGGYVSVRLCTGKGGGTY